jgi:REP element-mobilizing transposase RayT
MIFTPKYRRDVFTDDEVRRMYLESFAETCYALSIRMETCEFGRDHIHLFVNRCKNYSVPYLAQRFKSTSSHRIRYELWGDSFWSDGYFYGR